jgi:L-lactate dehydrogenase
LEKNAAIYRDIVPKIVNVAPRAVLVAVTDPPDPLADVARNIAGHDRVLSTGTFLDSLRFRVHLGAHFGVDPVNVEAQVIGDHGTSQVFLWSSARIASVPLARLLQERRESLADLRAKVENDVRYANITIIEGHDASQYGIGIVSARIAEMVLRDERSAIPIGSFRQDYGVTLSLPSIVGRTGVISALPPELSPEEQNGLQKSADNLRKALECVGS